MRLCLLWWKEGSFVKFRRWLFWIRVKVGAWLLLVVLRMEVIWVRIEVGFVLSVVRNFGIYS